MSSKKKWTKTTSFLLPACGLDVATLLEHNFHNAYLNDDKYEREVDDNEIDIFIVFNAAAYDEEREDFFNVLRSHSLFLEEYDTSDHVVFRFKIDPKWNHVKKELSTSKYSKIDREYVDKYFGKSIITGRDHWGNPVFQTSNNWRILTKCPTLKEEWEEKLDVKISEDNELWEKLHPEEEIFRFTK
jgi:hypothetical protein